MGNSKSHEQEAQEMDASEDENEDGALMLQLHKETHIEQNNSLYYKKKKCIRYVDDKGRCAGCKELEASHTQVYSSTVWESAECTVSEITDAFGKIKFPSGYRKKAKYIRLADDTNAYDILKYLVDDQGFAMSLPKLLISVTGGAKQFTVDEKTKKAIKKGLVKASKSTNAWIVTGGTNVGVMRLVGDAVCEDLRASKLHVLGIASWGAVAFRDKLIRNVASNDLNVVEYFPEDILGYQEGNAVPLNPNHTHFLLVDNGSVNKFGVEIKFRAELENVVQETYKIPMVLLVIEGGPGSLQAVYETLLKNIPIILIARTKGASDLIIEAKEACKLKVLSDSELKSLLVKWKIHKSPLDLHVGQLRDILNETYDNLINIFNMTNDESENDIEGIILRAISKSKPYTSIAYHLPCDDTFFMLKIANTDLEKLVEVAIRWNRYEDAQNNLGLMLHYKDPHEFKSKINKLFNIVLLENRYNFINLLFENGLNLNDFLTPQVLGELYNYEITLYHTQNSTKIQSPFILYLIKTKKIRFGAEADAADVDAITERITSDILKSFLRARFGYFNAYFMPHDFEAFETDDNKVLEKEFNLFLWCVLSNRIRMAKIFWRIGKNQLLYALIAVKLLRYLAIDQPEYTTTLEKSANEFEQMAIGVLNVFERNTRDVLNDILIVRYFNFLHKDCLELAVDAKCTNFVSHRLVQKVMDDIWFGSKSNLKLTKFERSLKKCQMDQNKRDFDYVFKNYDNTSRTSSSSLEKLRKIPNFFQQPFTHFISNAISYIAFLITFSYLMLFDYKYKIEVKDEFKLADNLSFERSFNETTIFESIEEVITHRKHVSVLEFVILFWVICLFYEECRQFFHSKTTQYYKWKLKIKTYFKSEWNILDLIGCLLFFIGFLLRIISLGTNEQVFTWSRIILSVDLALWFIRSLHFCLLLPSLGPKIVMIRKMIDDLKYFMIIVLTFIFGFGISLQAIMFPNQELSVQTFLEIFNMAYWPIYGEIILLETLNDDACKNGTLSDCADRSSVVTSYFILMIYMIIASVLLLNILIAMFSSTFEDIQKDANLIWKNQRYDLICEYINFPVLPPPFNLLCHLVKFIIKSVGDLKPKEKN